MLFNSNFHSGAAAILAVALVSFAASELQTRYVDAATIEDPIVVVVMDPLCDRLACDCVEGYAQRKYEVLGRFLQSKLARPINLYWGESIQDALEETDATADLVIGKHSVIVSETSELKVDYHPVAQLTGQQGEVTQTGLIVVRRGDPAKKVADLAGYRVFFGPADCDEKHAAPKALLKKHGVKLPARLEISGACSEAATKLVELDGDIKAAAIISSYAEPLLAGCGTIEKGELRVIGVSQEVPFVTAFINARHSKDARMKIVEALLAVESDAATKAALETADGFIRYKKQLKSPRPAKRNPTQTNVTATAKKK